MADKLGALQTPTSPRRTPSAANLQLANLDFPEPSRVTAASRQADDATKTNRLNKDLADLKLSQPEAISRQNQAVLEDDRQDAIGEVISKLDLPDPERVLRASAQADGLAEPNVQPRSEHARVISPPSSPTTSRTMRLPNTGAASASTSKDPADRVVEPAAQVTGVPVQSGVDQVVTPWDVEGAVVDGKQVAIDYDKLIVQFGTQKIGPALLERFERATGVKPHLLLRRGIFFSHRELERILDRHEKGEPFYLYTGRGPSSDAMHLGHMVPFTFTAYLQRAFGCVCVIQLTDDEKFFFKPSLTVEDTKRFARSNAQDIIACGFVLEKTFIFSNFDYMGGAFYANVARIGRGIPYNQSKATFGFTDSDAISKSHFVAIQAAPAFSNSFPQIFGTNSQIPCLIPQAIDQDPYFRLTRDVAAKLHYPKPALIHSRFFPALQGAQSKMSASNETSSVFMSDTPNQIKNKINKYAFSGGQTSVEEHRKLGGDPDVDVAYQYLLHLEDSDEEMARLAAAYRSGELLTGELKKVCITKLQQVVGEFQARKALVTDDIVNQYMDASRKIDPTPIRQPAAQPAAAVV